MSPSASNDKSNSGAVALAIIGTLVAVIVVFMIVAVNQKSKEIDGAVSDGNCVTQYAFSTDPNAVRDCQIANNNP
jgi:predicted lipoprotein with Yx(FWY)xxD motif